MVDLWWEARGLSALWAESDAMDPINEAVWTEAREATRAFPPPYCVTPIQVGGVAVEWRGDLGRVEVRFRGGTPFVVIEGRRCRERFYCGPDGGLMRAAEAIGLLCPAGGGGDPIAVASTAKKWPAPASCAGIFEPENRAYAAVNGLPK